LPFPSHKLSLARSVRPVGAIIAIVMVLSFVAFWPVLTNAFVSWDDQVFVQGGSGTGLRWQEFRDTILGRKFPAFAYYPVFHLSLAMDRTLWGGKALGYHLTNLVLHIVSALLVFGIGMKIFAFHGRMPRNSRLVAAGIAAILFAIHPVNVEPVAWASGRKVVLAVLLCLLSFSAYLRSEQHPKWRVCSSLCFALACLSNAVAAPLPLLIIAYDRLLCNKAWWSTLRRRSDLLAIGLGAALLRIRRVTPVMDADMLPPGLIERSLMAVNALFTQSVSLLVPIRLSQVYPNTTGIPAQTAAAIVMVAASLALMWRVRKRRVPLFCLVWFCAALAPTAAHHHTRADRHLYLPAIGLFWLAGAGAAYLLRRARTPATTCVAVACGMVILSLLVLSREQARTWRDSETLWTNVLEVSPSLCTACNNLAGCWLDENRVEPAIAFLNMGLRHSPSSLALHLSRARAFQLKADYKRAIADYTTAIGLDSECAEAYNNRGNALIQIGAWEAAISDCTKAIQLAPKLFEAYDNRGLAYSKQGRYDQAIRDYDRAIALSCDSHEVFLHRANARAAVGEYPLAIEDYSRAITLAPDEHEAFLNRGNAHFETGRPDLAIRDYSTAIEFRPTLFEAYYNRGNVCVEQGRYDVAIRDYTKAHGLKPGLTAPLIGRGNVHFKNGAYELAIHDYTHAIELDPRCGAAYLNRAVAYYARATYDMALADVRVAQELGAEVPAAFLRAVQKSHQ